MPEADLDIIEFAKIDDLLEYNDEKINSYFLGNYRNPF